MEKERDRAKQYGYASPMYPDKVSVDNAFNSASDFCVNNIDNIAVCVATHNERSCMHLVNRVDAMGIKRNHPHIFFSQLYWNG